MRKLAVTYREAKWKELNERLQKRTPYYVCIPPGQEDCVNLDDYFMAFELHEIANALDELAQEKGDPKP
jgi:hypothetical protein